MTSHTPSRIPIVVTAPEYRKAQAVFDGAADLDVHVVAPDEASVAAAIRAADAWAAVLGVEPYREALYAALPRGGLIARFGVGHDGIDKARAAAAGLLVTNTPGVLEQSGTEHTLALILAVVKGLATFVRAFQRHEWAPHVTSEVRGKTLAVIGCGAIGRRVARLAARGFGMNVVGVRRHLAAAAELTAEWGFATVTTDFAGAVADADVVTLHVPGTPENRHLIDAAALRLFPRRALLVNTSRGMLVDEVALYDAVAAGALAGAALDVMAIEPYVPHDVARDLRRLPQILLTPHVSSATREACGRVAESALRNIREARRATSRR